MMSSILPTIVQAAQEQNIQSAALAYAALGLSIIPLDGKRPALTSWTQYQQKAASPEAIQAWNTSGPGMPHSARGPQPRRIRRATG